MNDETSGHAIIPHGVLMPIIQLSRCSPPQDWLKARSTENERCGHVFCYRLNTGRLQLVCCSSHVDVAESAVTAHGVVPLCSSTELIQARPCFPGRAALNVFSLNRV